MKIKPSFTVAVYMTRGKELLGTIRETLAWRKTQQQEQEWRFAVFARALAEFCDDRHWERERNADGDSFGSANEWMTDVAEEFELKRSSLWNAYWVGNRLAPHLSESVMKEIGKSKLYLLAEATPAGQPPAPELVERARTMRVDEFKASITQPLLNGETAKDLDLVEVETFWVKRHERDFVEEVLDMGRIREGVESRHRALVAALQIAHREWAESGGGDA